MLSATRVFSTCFDRALFHYSDIQYYGCKIQCYNGYQTMILFHFLAPKDIFFFLYIWKFYLTGLFLDREIKRNLPSCDLLQNAHSSKNWKRPVMAWPKSGAKDSIQMSQLSHLSAASRGSHQQGAIQSQRWDQTHMLLHAM